MQQIFKYVNCQENGLYSCLLVNKYWCKNVLPLLWASPFKCPYILSSWIPLNSYTLSKEAFTQLNKYKFIDIYLSCLDDKEFFYLKSLFQNHYSIKLSSGKSGKKPLMNYPSFLQEIFYDDMEMTIYFYLMNNFRQNFKEQQILVIATFLMKLFLSESTNLRIINFDRYKIFYKLDIPNLLPVKSAKTLDRLVKFQINHDRSILTQNTINLLTFISFHCKNIHYLDFKFKHYEYNDKILQLIIGIIKSQNHLSEFNISNIKNHFEIILLNLLLLHKNTLVSIRLDHVYITETSVDILKQFMNIRKIKLLHCNKCTSEVLLDYSEYLEIFKKKKRFVK